MSTTLHATLTEKASATYRSGNSNYYLEKYNPPTNTAQLKISFQITDKMNGDSCALTGLDWIEISNDPDFSQAATARYKTVSYSPGFINEITVSPSDYGQESSSPSITATIETDSSAAVYQFNRCLLSSHGGATRIYFRALLNTASEIEGVPYPIDGYDFVDIFWESDRPVTPGQPQPNLLNPDNLFTASKLSWDFAASNEGTSNIARYMADILDLREIKILPNNQVTLPVAPNITPIENPEEPNFSSRELHMHSFEVISGVDSLISNTELETNFLSNNHPVTFASGLSIKNDGCERATRIVTTHSKPDFCFSAHVIPTIPAETNVDFITELFIEKYIEDESHPYNLLLFKTIIRANSLDQSIKRQTNGLGKINKKITLDIPFDEFNTGGSFEFYYHQADITECQTNQATNQIQSIKHGLSVNDTVVFSTTQGDLLAGVTYYVTSITTDTFTISNTLGGENLTWNTGGDSAANQYNTVNIIAIYYTTDKQSYLIDLVSTPAFGLNEPSTFAGVRFYPANDSAAGFEIKCDAILYATGQFIINGDIAASSTEDQSSSMFPISKTSDWNNAIGNTDSFKWKDNAPYSYNKEIQADNSIIIRSPLPENIISSGGKSINIALCGDSVDINLPTTNTWQRIDVPFTATEAFPLITITKTFTEDDVIFYCDGLQIDSDFLPTSWSGLHFTPNIGSIETDLTGFTATEDWIMLHEHNLAWTGSHSLYNRCAADKSGSLSFASGPTELNPGSSYVFSMYVMPGFEFDNVYRDQNGIYELGLTTPSFSNKLNFSWEMRHTSGSFYVVFSPEPGSGTSNIISRCSPNAPETNIYTNIPALAVMFTIKTDMWARKYSYINVIQCTSDGNITNKFISKTLIDFPVTTNTAYSLDIDASQPYGTVLILKKNTDIIGTIELNSPISANKNGLGLYTAIGVKSDNNQSDATTYTDSEGSPNFAVSLASEGQTRIYDCSLRGFPSLNTVKEFNVRQLTKNTSGNIESKIKLGQILLAGNVDTTGFMSANQDIKPQIYAQKITIANNHENVVFNDLTLSLIETKMRLDQLITPMSICNTDMVTNKIQLIDHGISNNQMVKFNIPIEQTTYTNCQLIYSNNKYIVKKTNHGFTEDNQGTPITFLITALPGIIAGETYYVESIVDIDSFTVKTEGGINVTWNNSPIDNSYIATGIIPERTYYATNIEQDSFELLANIEDITSVDILSNSTVGVLTEIYPQTVKAALFADNTGAPGAIITDTDWIDTIPYNAPLPCTDLIQFDFKSYRKALASYLASSNTFWLCVAVPPKYALSTTLVSDSQPRDNGFFGVPPSACFIIDNMWFKCFYNYVLKQDNIVDGARIQARVLAQSNAINNNLLDINTSCASILSTDTGVDITPPIITNFSLVPNELGQKNILAISANDTSGILGFRIATEEASGVTYTNWMSWDAFSPEQDTIYFNLCHNNYFDLANNPIKSGSRKVWVQILDKVGNLSQSQPLTVLIHNVAITDFDAPTAQTQFINSDGNPVKISRIPNLQLNTFDVSDDSTYIKDIRFRNVGSSVWSNWIAFSEYLPYVINGSLDGLYRIEIQVRDFGNNITRECLLSDMIFESSDRDIMFTSGVIVNDVAYIAGIKSQTISNLYLTLLPNSPYQDNRRAFYATDIALQPIYISPNDRSPNLTINGRAYTRIFDPNSVNGDCYFIDAEGYFVFAGTLPTEPLSFAMPLELKRETAILYRWNKSTVTSLVELASFEERAILSMINYDSDNTIYLGGYSGNIYKFDTILEIIADVVYVAQDTYTNTKLPVSMLAIHNFVNDIPYLYAGTSLVPRLYRWDMNSESSWEEIIDAVNITEYLPSTSGSITSAASAYDTLFLGTDSGLILELNANLGIIVKKLDTDSIVSTLCSAGNQVVAGLDNQPQIWTCSATYRDTFDNSKFVPLPLASSGITGAAEWQYYSNGNSIPGVDDIKRYYIYSPETVNNFRYLTSIVGVREQVKMLTLDKNSIVGRIIPSNIQRWTLEADMMFISGDNSGKQGFRIMDGHNILDIALSKSNIYIKSGSQYDTIPMAQQSSASILEVAKPVQIMDTIIDDLNNPVVNNIIAPAHGLQKMWNFRDGMENYSTYWQSPDANISKPTGTANLQNWTADKFCTLSTISPSIIALNVHPEPVGNPRITCNFNTLNLNSQSKILINMQIGDGTTAFQGSFGKIKVAATNMTTPNWNHVLWSEAKLLESDDYNTYEIRLPMCGMIKSLAIEFEGLPDTRPDIHIDFIAIVDDVDTLSIPNIAYNPTPIRISVDYIGTNNIYDNSLLRIWVGETEHPIAVKYGFLSQTTTNKQISFGKLYLNTNEITGTSTDVELASTWGYSNIKFAPNATGAPITKHITEFNPQWKFDNGNSVSKVFNYYGTAWAVVDGLSSIYPTDKPQNKYAKLYSYNPAKEIWEEQIPVFGNCQISKTYIALPYQSEILIAGQQEDEEAAPPTSLAGSISVAIHNLDGTAFQLMIYLFPLAENSGNPIDGESVVATPTESYITIVFDNLPPGDYSVMAWGIGEFHLDSVDEPIHVVAGKVSTAYVEVISP